MIEKLCIECVTLEWTHIIEFMKDLHVIIKLGVGAKLPFKMNIHWKRLRKELPLLLPFSELSSSPWVCKLREKKSAFFKFSCVHDDALQIAVVLFMKTTECCLNTLQCCRLHLCKQQLFSSMTYALIILCIHSILSLNALKQSGSDVYQLFLSKQTFKEIKLKASHRVVVTLEMLIYHVTVYVYADMDGNECLCICKCLSYVCG